MRKGSGCVSKNAETFREINNLFLFGFSGFLVQSISERIPDNYQTFRINQMMLNHFVLKIKNFIMFIS